MTFTLKSNILKAIGFFFLLPFFVFAQTTQTISVSPTLFEIKATQEQVWQSELRIVNVNNYDLVVYPQVVNFAPLGETGRGELIPINAAETNGATLAEWVEITGGPVVVPEQQTITLPFTIRAPADAPPGGHYAAIMIGTKPPIDSDTGSQFVTAQFVTSLLFVRMAGQVVEEGTIREFRAVDRLVQVPDITFEVRFENKGTVHLQPRGEIKIMNMWGTERGTIPINQQTNFGNVLPNSVRQFLFSWHSEASLYDIGRYKAIATLAYGDEQQQFTYSETYFWVIPFKQLGVVILIFGVSAGLLVMLVRMYVRRMLALAGIQATPHQRSRHYGAYELPLRKNRGVKTVIVRQYEQATAPLRFEYANFRRLFVSDTAVSFYKRLSHYLWDKRYVLLATFTVIAGILALVIIVRVALSAVRSYEVTIHTGGSDITLSAEDLRYAELKSGLPALVELSTSTAISVVNVSGVAGMAAEVRAALERKGYAVTDMSADVNRTERKTVIIYHPAVQNTALAISRELDGALLSADSERNENSIVVNVGYEYTPSE
jgi:hypothetical protein